MKYLYTIPTPGQSQPAERTIAGKELSTKGAVDVSSAVVDAIASQATDLTLEGQYRWGRSTSVKLASELDELADSSITSPRSAGSTFADSTAMQNSTPPTSSPLSNGETSGT